MNYPDLINGLFEGLAGVMQATNVWMLYKDKEVKGVNIWSQVFYNIWGIWGLWYYPYLGQYISCFGDSVIVIFNLIWIFLAFKYRLEKK